MIIKIIYRKRDVMLLSANHLSKEFPTSNQQPFVAVQDVSFTVPTGRVVAFLGPNGAGKTTTIKMLLGLITPTHGTIQVLGHPVARTLGAVGAVLEGSRNIYWRLSPLENFEYWGGLRGIPRKIAQKRGMAYLTTFGLAAKADQPVRALSRGMQQIVAICCALIHQPQLLLLDEPTLGLDLTAAEQIQTIIRQLVADTHLGVLLTTHDMSVAQAIADDVLMIDQGTIVFRGETQSALRGFSSETYALSFAKPLMSPELTQLGRWGTMAPVSPTQVIITLADTHPLSELLGYLGHLPITAIEKQQVDLAALFKHVIRQHQKGVTVHVDRREQ
jgi:ABC-2 type transport system ATP-binding protein